MIADPAVAAAYGEFRQTMGRMAESVERLKANVENVCIALRVDPGMDAAITRYMAERGERNRARAVRDLIERGLRVDA